ATLGDDDDLGRNDGSVVERSTRLEHVASERRLDRNAKRGLSQYATGPPAKADGQRFGWRRAQRRPRPLPAQPSTRSRRTTELMNGKDDPVWPSRRLRWLAWFVYAAAWSVALLTPQPAVFAQQALPPDSLPVAARSE